MGARGALARGLALRLASEGANIALTTATPDAEEAFELRRVSRAVTDLGRTCMVESVDLSLGTSVQVTVRQVAKALGRIDLLVVAPDLRLDRAVERLSDADWSKLLGVNLSGAFFACRAVAREMLGQEPRGDGKRGRIVAVTQETNQSDNAAYRAAKAGLAGLIAALDEEWSDRGLGVSLIVLPEGDEEAAAASVAQQILDLVV
jgi:NAD(P)-dependent dehydrogenase (short-subunit alcohol dehydrogenase family)